MSSGRLMSANNHRQQCRQQANHHAACVRHAIDPGDLTLTVDDGTAEASAGFATTTQALFLQQLTPPVFPATLKAIRIYFPTGIEAIPLNTPVTLVAAMNPASAVSLNRLSYRALVGTVRAQGQWVEFTLNQPLTLTAQEPGDFVVGPSTESGPGLKPVAIDMSSAPAGRSYVSTDDGATVQPVSSALEVNGNCLIRAVVAISGGT
ncbi:MAG: hypothetical protein HY821_11560 [Acidobacteria bacterium]|nr:hypothetical protein [Acidobacteriota bacterium]